MPGGGHHGATFSLSVPDGCVCFHMSVIVLYVISDPSFALNVNSLRVFSYFMWSSESSLAVNASALLVD